MESLISFWHSYLHLDLMAYYSWIGTLLLTFCGIPQAYRSIKDGHSEGISWGLLSMWGFGDLLTMIYSFTLHSPQLVINYAANAIACYIIFHYKIRPRQRKRKRNVRATVRTPKS